MSGREEVRAPAGGAPSSSPASASAERPPVVSESIVDGPTQRLYAASLFALAQAYKLSDFYGASFSSSEASAAGADAGNLLLKWVVLDVALVWLIAQLRIPRLALRGRAAYTCSALIGTLNWALFGDWHASAALLSAFVPNTLKALFARYPTTEEVSMRLSKILGRDNLHLSGAYTIHVLAMATAQLRLPPSACYCLTQPSPLFAQSGPLDAVHVPIVFNNTLPAYVTYSIAPFGGSPKVYHNKTLSELVPSAQSTLRRRQGRPRHDDVDLLIQQMDSDRSASLYHASAEPHHAASSDVDVASSETLFYIPISTTGVFELEGVYDVSGAALRVRRTSNELASRTAHGGSVRIVECPSAGFARPSELHRCQSSAPDGGRVDLGLRVRGAEPLTVSWRELLREDGRRAPTTREGKLEGIRSGAPLLDGSGEIISIPYNVSLDVVGAREFWLESVRDGCGNTVEYARLRQAVEAESAASGPAAAGVPGSSVVSRKTLEGRKGAAAGRSAIARLSAALPDTYMTTDVRDLTVHQPPRVVFSGSCTRGADPIRRLVGQSVALDVQISGDMRGESSQRQGTSALDKLVGQQPSQLEGVGPDGWSVRMRFTPDDDDEGQRASAWEKDVHTLTPNFKVQADAAGTYELISIDGKWCEGSVLSPSSCSVVTQMAPTLAATWEPIIDSCSAEIGSVAHMRLSGAPPFTINYIVEQLRPVRRVQRQSKRISHLHDDIRITPPPGEYRYRFESIQDAFYRNVALPADAALASEQAIPVVAKATWRRGAGAQKQVMSCEGDSVSLEVDLEGHGPWDITYVAGGQKSVTLSGIAQSPHAFDISIPPHIAKRGGQFSVTLESVKDSADCLRMLQSEDMLVDVRRTKPSAHFPGTTRSTTVRQGEKAKIPLRLTGERPWTLTYVSPRSSRPIEFTAQQPNVDITVSGHPGAYRLVSVKDRYCPGYVYDAEWEVSTLPRPWVRLGEDAGTLARNGSVIRAPVCEGADDEVPIELGGKPPYEVVYDLSKNGGRPSPRKVQAIRGSTSIELVTGTAGHYTYEIASVGDSLYKADKDGVLGTGGMRGVARLEQDIFATPTARFTRGAKLAFCTNDRLESRSSDELIVQLEGEAPFTLEVEVREDGHKAPERYTIQNIETHEWPLRVPHRFEAAAFKHFVALRHVSDAHGCGSNINPSISGASVSLAVAEVASIAPVSPQTSHCVGDFLDFVIQGAPPFTVTYEFDGRRHVVPLSSAKFSRVAASAGVFKILSVGHGQDQCRTNDVDLIKVVHPLPSASISAGTNFVEDLQEGDQAEIKFTFEGTPPFAFTYSRRKAQDRSHDRTILETHTVTGIESHEYSIYTSQEGTWTVSYVSDAHCSYPPAPKSEAGIKA